MKQCKERDFHEWSDDEMRSRFSVSAGEQFLVVELVKLRAERDQLLRAQPEAARIEIVCERLRLELDAALTANVALSEALSDCMNSLQESNFCFKPGCGDGRCERATAAWNTGHACLAKYGAVKT